MSDVIHRLRSALADRQLVQSFSGVRTVFGPGPDLSDEHRALAQAYGYCYARDVLAPGSEALFVLGRDPRPTGRALAESLLRGFAVGARTIGCRLRVADLGIITTPLAETAVRALRSQGGVMVTASHNPLDHNGFKFFTGTGAEQRPDAAPPGALLSASDMERVIREVALLAEREGLVELETLDAELEPTDRRDHEQARVVAERAYLDVIGEDWGITPHCLKPLTLGPALLDPNGGAGCGIDARVLEHFGVKVIEINAELGYPEHAIDTDGIDPASGRHMLLRVARAALRERAHFGVAFDYDADRGNLVLPGQNEEAIIPPQKVATFNIALALTRRKLRGERGRPLAVVLSDSTSLASERVARAFGAEVVHVETGEINVVTRMHQLRRQGYDVPVGVEGANGGTIFETSTCRDGLQAALSAALAEAQPEVSAAWLSHNGGTAAPVCEPGERISLSRLVASIPSNPNASIRLTAPPLPHAVVKRRLEAHFAERLWPELADRFESYRFVNFEGTRVGPDRTGDETGGWRVELRSPDRAAFVFVRGSRTESGLWRMIVDADDPGDFEELLPRAQTMFDTASLG
ncbi:MAG: hypothetical protein N2109_06580 [Fimbriimonadales bacterium]|nr:hypothetical protein [Fimbriimonadales bacterium]